MTLMSSGAFTRCAALAFGLFSTAASAQEFGHAVPNQMGLIHGATAIGEYMDWFHNALLLTIITVISLSA